MKIKINNLIITLTLLISFNVVSQEKISIVVLKGYAILQNSTTESIKINRGKKMTFPANSIFVINKNNNRQKIGINLKLPCKLYESGRL